MNRDILAQEINFSGVSMEETSSHPNPSKGQNPITILSVSILCIICACLSSCGLILGLTNHLRLNPPMICLHAIPTEESILYGLRYSSGFGVKREPHDEGLTYRIYYLECPTFSLVGARSSTMGVRVQLFDGPTLLEDRVVSMYVEGGFVVIEQFKKN
jgi:hypothetical protein